MSGLIVLAVIYYFGRPPTTDVVHLVLKVSDAKSHASIPHAQIRVAAEHGAFTALTDDNGIASISVPVRAGSRGPIRMTVVLYGFTASNGLLTRTIETACWKYRWSRRRTLPARQIANIA